MEPRGQNFENEVFGFANSPILASVYSERVIQKAKRDGIEFQAPTLLGNVIAHEIGHLLLGKNGHATTGIMRSKWQRDQIRAALTGNLRFKDTESTCMLAELRKRSETLTALRK